MMRTRYPWQRYLLAHWRDVRVLLRQFYIPLALLAFSVLLGGLIFDLLYTHAEVQDLTYGESVYAIFSMIFFGESIPYPQQWYLRVFFFIMPIIGLGLIVQGVINFGVMLFNKSAREDEWQVAIASTYKDHVIVAGIGRLGFRICQQLIEFGEDVVGVEINPESEFVQRVLDIKVPIIFGNATHPDVLKQASVQRAAAIVTCTEYDLTNLEIALIARELKEDIRVVLRMFDHDMAQRVAGGFDIQTAFSTSAMAAPAFARAAMHSDVTHAFYVGEQLLNVSEMILKARSELISRKVCDLELELDFSMILHCRDGEVDLHPSPEIELQADDQIYVLASVETLSKLNGMNR